MKKFFKRFGAVVFAIALCFTMNTAVMAAEVAESVDTDAVSPRATTVGTVTFSYANSGDQSTDGEALLPSNSKSVTFRPSAPNQLTYIVQSNGKGTPQCKIQIDNQTEYALDCDGRAHTLTIGAGKDIPWALSANRGYQCHYRGVNLISISLVFSRA